MTTQVYQFPCLKDNYGVLIHDSAPPAPPLRSTRPTATPSSPPPRRKGWTITDVLVTHHHADHTQGIPGVRAAFPGLRVVGPAKEAARIAGLDLEVARATSSMSARSRPK